MFIIVLNFELILSVVTSANNFHFLLYWKYAMMFQMIYPCFGL